MSVWYLFIYLPEGPIYLNSPYIWKKEKNKRFCKCLTHVFTCLHGFIMLYLYFYCSILQYREVPVFFSILQLDYLIILRTTSSLRCHFKTRKSRVHILSLTLTKSHPCYHEIFWAGKLWYLTEVLYSLNTASFALSICWKLCLYGNKTQRLLLKWQMLKKGMSKFKRVTGDREEIPVEY